VAGSVAMRAVTLHDPRQMLLDDVLDRFMPDVKEKKFYRRRVLGDKKSLSIPGDYPEQLVTDLKELPPRPTFSPRTTQSMPGSPRGKNRVDRVSGESKAGGSPHHIKDRVGVIGGRNRTVQINSGTKTLEATMKSIQPKLKDATPLTLTTKKKGEEEDDEARSRKPSRAGSSRGDDGMNEHELFSLQLMMGLNEDNLVALKQAFAKFRNELDVYEFVAVMLEHVGHMGSGLNDMDDDTDDDDDDDDDEGPEPPKPPRRRRRRRRRIVEHHHHHPSSRLLFSYM